MASDLLNNTAGVIALRTAIHDQIERRIRRWFKRNFVEAFDNWVAGGKTAFALQTVLGNLNVSHDSEILNLLDLLQQFENQVITQDYDVYCDSVNGDDVEGVGTADSPFASLPRAQRLIPKTIASNVNIFLSGTFSEVAAEDRKITGDGQLAYQSIEDPTVLSPGPWTINTFTALGPGTCANAIAVLGGPWVPENFKGAYVRILDGAQQGSIYAISHNTANTLIVGYTDGNPAPGDTFEIIQPTTVITDPSFFWRIHIKSENWDYPDSNFIISGVVIPIFINLTADTLEMKFPFSSINAMQLSGSLCIFNDLEWKDPTQAFNSEWTKVNTNNCYIATVYSDMLTCRFSKTTIGKYWAQQPNQYLYRCSFEEITQNIQPDTGIFLYTSYMHNDGTDPAIETMEGCLRLTIERLYVEQCTDIIYAERCDIKITDTLQIGAGITGVILNIGANAQVSFDGVMPSPAAGDVTWRTTGATVGQPAVAGTSITDGNGSFVVKLT